MKGRGYNEKGALGICGLVLGQHNASRENVGLPLCEAMHGQR